MRHTASIIEKDSTLSEKALMVYYKLQVFEGRFKEIEEEENKRLKEENISAKTADSEEMHKMFEFQMKLHQEILDKQSKVDTKMSAVKLPKLDIPSFNGNKLYWIEFWDSFESAVHKKEGLSGIDTFNCLKSKLTGEARIAIAGLSLSNENYEIAIRTLQERFGDSPEVIDLHYKTLLDIVPARNSTESLRHFLDKSEKRLRSLEDLKQDTNQEVFVSMIRRKLPSDVLLQLEIMKGAGSKWSVCRLRDLLRQYIVAKEKAEKN
ncbi:uncharacterized protein LOC128555859 [Mercenaria mercenaria]|uniref:uncharacterized protein LOC128555859 n=1 Tax=Mercenaria mercenaria TaxID=6596 RepID=UPI00234F19D5|nr:uncharacterized protein LOC128555859 [Mercenaria mercenaria]